MEISQNSQFINCSTNVDLKEISRYFNFLQYCHGLTFNLPRGKTSHNIIYKVFFQLTKPFSIYCLILSPTTLRQMMRENLTFAQQVTVCKILHLNDLIECSPSLIANVHPKRLSNCSFLHADFLSLEVKFPMENVQSCLVHTPNPSSFLKILFKEDIIFASSSQERDGVAGS